MRHEGHPRILSVANVLQKPIGHEPNHDGPFLVGGQTIRARKIRKTPILRFVVHFVNRVVSHSSSTVTAAAAATRSSCSSTSSSTTTTTRPAQAVRSRLNLGLRQRRRFVLHTRILQHVGVLAASPGVTVFQMLPEMVGTEEFLRLVALAELVHRGQMFEASVPIRSRHVGELFAAVAANVRTRGCCRRGSVKGCFVVGEVGA